MARNSNRTTECGGGMSLIEFVTLAYTRARCLTEGAELSVYGIAFVLIPIQRFGHAWCGSMQAQVHESNTSRLLFGVSVYHGHTKLVDKEHARKLAWNAPGIELGQRTAN